MNPAMKQQVTRRLRLLSTTATSEAAAAAEAAAAVSGTAVVADIVKGPSLLRTTVATRPRPSLLHLPGLRALPFWTTQQQQQQQQPDGNKMCGTAAASADVTTNMTTTRVAYGDAHVTAVVRHLEAHYREIWEEYQLVAPTMASDYETDTEHNKLHEGQWDWHSYMTKGNVVDEVVGGDADVSSGKNNDTTAAAAAVSSFRTRFPVTAGILQQLRENDEQESTTTTTTGCNGQLFEGTPFGYAFFSTLHGRSAIRPHTAPMNLRLRVHLALSVPSSSAAAAATTVAAATAADDEERSRSGSSSQRRRPACGIRVGAVTREWHAGKCLVLDDSYEHEAWNDTAVAADPRVVLLVDLWHPDISRSERREIVGMFEAAKQQGWLH